MFVWLWLTAKYEYTYRTTTAGCLDTVYDGKRTKQMIFFFSFSFPHFTTTAMRAKMLITKATTTNKTNNREKRSTARKTEFSSQAFYFFPFSRYWKRNQQKIVKNERKWEKKSKIKHLPARTIYDEKKEESPLLTSPSTYHCFRLRRKAIKYMQQRRPFYGIPRWNHRKIVSILSREQQNLKWLKGIPNIIERGGVKSEE